ncbi:MAG: glycosyltransferase [Bacteroidales bacterium]
MMLSVLIPVHNHDVNRLVNGLQKQLQKSCIDYEIILLDDASKYDYWVKNAKVDFLPQVTFLRNMVNVGRAKLRNTLVSKAQYPYILFIDCDAAIIDQQYIARYLEQIKILQNETEFVMNGGVAYRKKAPRKNRILRWYYGTRREQISAAIRNQHPYKSFTPFNVLMTKSIFKKIEFNENLTTYGNEDTLFGCQLRHLKIPVHHLDNPLYHDGLDVNEEYLDKVKTSIDNLIYLIENNIIDHDFIEDNKLLKTYQKCKKWGLHKLLSWYYQQGASLMRKSLCRRPNLFLLDLYKLTYLSTRSPAFIF